MCIFEVFMVSEIAAGGRYITITKLKLNLQQKFWIYLPRSVHLLSVSNITEWKNNWKYTLKQATFQILGFFENEQ